MDDAYGHDAAQMFQSELARSGWGCLAYVELFPWGSDPAKVQRLVSVMKKSTARVVVVFVYGIRLIKLLDEVGFMIHVNLGTHDYKGWL